MTLWVKSVVFGALLDVRFTPEGGHQGGRGLCPLSTADVITVLANQTPGRSLTTSPAGPEVRNAVARLTS